VFAEMGAALDAFSGDAMFDAVVGAGSATARVVVTFVGMESSWAMTRLSAVSAKRWNNVK